jgi:hypothetical protein
MYEDSHLEMDYEDRYPEYYDSDVWDAEDFSEYSDDSGELYDPDGRFVPEQFVQDSDVTDIEHELDTWVNSPVRLPFGLIFS